MVQDVLLVKKYALKTEAHERGWDTVYESSIQLVWKKAGEQITRVTDYKASNK